MLLYVRNTVVSLWGTVERSTEQKLAHFVCAFCCHFSQKHLHFEQMQTKKQQSLNTLLESTFSGTVVTLQRKIKLQDYFS